jgi:AcrR family transcriptional regulator
VLAVVEKLFYSEGIRATGVDTVAARAGVGPTTLYRLYESKDALVAAYIERFSEQYKAVLLAAISSPGLSPRDKILAVIDTFAQDIRSPSCRGCPFLLALAEYPDPESDAHVKAVAHKAWVRELFHRLVDELAQTTALHEPDSLADGLALVAEGMYGSAQALGPSGPAVFGRTCAEALISASQPAGS